VSVVDDRMVNFRLTARVCLSTEALRACRRGAARHPASRQMCGDPIHGWMPNDISENFLS